MVIKRKPKLTLNTAIVRKNPTLLKNNTNLNSAVSFARDERMNSSRNILNVLEGGKTYTKPIKILPNLYLGSCDASKDLSILLDKDITTILNLAAEVEKPKWFNSDHWMELSSNHWVTKISQDQLELMSISSDGSHSAASNKMERDDYAPPSPPPSEDEDSKKDITIFHLSPSPHKTYHPSLQNLPTSPIPMSPSSPVTPTSYGSSSQQTIVVSPVEETSFTDSVNSLNTLNTPTTSYFALPPETPFMDAMSTSTPFVPETPYVDARSHLNLPPETPYVDAFSTPMTQMPPETPYVDAFSTPMTQMPPETPYVDAFSTPMTQMPPETPYYDTNSNSNSISNSISSSASSALPIPETPYMDAYSSQQQQYLAKLINNSHQSIHNSNLLQAISLSSASTPPSHPFNTIKKCNGPSRPSTGLSATAQSRMGVEEKEKELEIHYYHQCWNHNQKNTQEKLIEAFNVIDSTRLEDQHSILVSCQQGVSRSATLVIAYVMKTKQWGLMKSYNFVKEKCPWIAPNITLMNDLSEFEQHLLQESQNSQK